MKRRPILSLLASLCLPCGGLSSAQAAPLKVYILAGQSNMEGHAKISSFDHIGMDPKTAPLLKAMRSEDGSPRVCERVWISYFTGGKDRLGEGHGPLTAGFGSRSDPKVPGEKIGPEFTFGITMEKHHKGPVLLIKTAWGGKSIHTDFRPPSGGAFEFSEEQLARFEKQEKNLDEIRQAKVEATGLYYRRMVDHVKAVLSDPGRVCPEYDEEEGYELAGVVWFQGWNDMVDSGVYPKRSEPGGYDAYSVQMAHFIRDIRSDLETPKLPFVIGVMGAGGPTELYGPEKQRYKSTHENFRNAMAAPASLPEFEGNVFAVWTGKYWDPELDVVAKKKKENPDALTEYDHKLLSGITNADYHYKGSGKVMAQIGEAFAKALIDKSGN